MLKDRLTSAPVLTLLEGRKGFVVYYDESRVGFGCVIMQRGKVLAYACRKLKVHKRKISLRILSSRRGFCLENMDALILWFSC